MINAINSGFYANYAQSVTSTQNRPQHQAITDDTFYVSADYELNKQKTTSSYDANIEYSTHSKLMDNLSNRVYNKRQSILGEVSQSRYERAVSSLATKMQELMQTLPKNSLSYEWADTLYGGFLFTQSPETMGYDEIDAYTIRLNGKTEFRTASVQDGKNKVIEAINNKSSSISSEVAKLEKELVNLDIHATQMPVAVTQFFATFESAFGENEMQGIIDDIATIMAYGEYNAHNITLADGSTISWEQNERGQISIFIDGIDINTALENADKVLTEMENFKTLLEMFKNRENSSDLNSVNSMENSILNKNANENSDKNLKDSVNLSKNSNSTLNSNTLNSNKTNSNRLNSSDSLLKVLLNSVSNDENLLKNLRV